MSTSGQSEREARAATARSSGGVSVDGGRPGREHGDARIEPPIDSADVARFLEAIRFGGEQAALGAVQEFVQRGVTAERIFLEVLAPAATTFDRLWRDDLCDFLDVTVAVGRLQRVLRSLSPQFHDEDPAVAPAGAMLLTGMPGYQHTLGLFMVAEFFVRAGWQVSMGWPVSHFDLHTAVRADWFDLVAFSVACEEELPRLTAEIKSVRRHSRNPRVKVLVGGRLFEQQPSLVARLGADAGTADARQAPILGAQLLRMDA